MDKLHLFIQMLYTLYIYKIQNCINRDRRGRGLRFRKMQNLKKLHSAWKKIIKIPKIDETS